MSTVNINILASNHKRERGYLCLSFFTTDVSLDSLPFLYVPLTIDTDSQLIVVHEQITVNCIALWWVTKDGDNHNSGATTHGDIESNVNKRNSLPVTIFNAYRQSSIGKSKTADRDHRKSMSMSDTITAMTKGSTSNLNEFLADRVDEEN
ncbi:hypothetical protein D9758_005218 [Tetrapyrgos nigripes]|uniref:Uncharacterized protein n=1 Tax=Tetrapyrgos nigripes TaxID=182062 RepID=A0A8H5LWE2_9AGAR|nr:hypothetical protein D9758_005218 [Tetrapyrgos nigripes]